MSTSGSSAPLASQRVAAHVGNCHRSIAPWRQRQHRWAAPPTEAAERRQQHHRRTHKMSRGLAVAAAAEAGGADEEIISGAFCMPAFVAADNKRSRCFTVLDVEVGDYPGLLRVISWTLNGLDVVAQNAVVRTSPEGQAHNTFWLTTRSGEKLDDAAAELLAERVRDFVMYCSPDESAKDKTDFCAGPVMVSNSVHPDYSVVMVQEPRPTPGFLLEVASALSGMNIQILQGVVQGGSCDEDGEDSSVLAIAGEDGPALEEQLDDGSCVLMDSNSSGRIFKFWVVNSQGQKLAYGDISALMYTLLTVLGQRSHPTVPPEQEVLMGAR